MIPFIIIVYDLFVGLKASIAAQPQGVRGLVSNARWLTVISWCFYPIVFGAGDKAAADRDGWRRRPSQYRLCV
jgi:bacteriorhodopsin